MGLVLVRVGEIAEVRLPPLRTVRHTDVTGNLDAK